MDDTNGRILKLVILLILVITLGLLFKIDFNTEQFNKMGPSIISGVVLIIGLMVFFSIIGFDLTPVQDKHVEKVVDIEAFEPISSSGFCKSYEGRRHELEKSCLKLTKSNCLSTSCCVYAKMDGKEECLSGDIHGPTFRREPNGRTRDIDFFYFRDKCYGDKCE